MFSKFLLVYAKQILAPKKDNDMLVNVGTLYLIY